MVDLAGLDAISIRKGYRNRQNIERLARLFESKLASCPPEARDAIIKITKDFHIFVKTDFFDDLETDSRCRQICFRHGVTPSEEEGGGGGEGGGVEEPLAPPSPSDAPETLVGWCVEAQGIGGLDLYVIKEVVGGDDGGEASPSYPNRNRVCGRNRTRAFVGRRRALSG